MNRFLGNIEARVDAKGRVFIPAPFRKKFVPVPAEAGGEREETCTVVLRKDIYQPCIVLYPEEVWSAEMDRLSSRLNPYNAAHRMILRQFVAEAEQATLDPSGRILISRRMLQSAGLGEKVRFIGMGETIEVWDAESTATPFLSPGEMTEKMNEAAENMEFELAARIRDRIAAINKLKERLTPGQWPELRERILAGQTLYGDLQEELLEQEGLYERLMDQVAALESLSTLDRWEDVLRSRFPERLRDTYIQCLEAQMCLAGDRKQYAAVIAYLKKLRTYPGGRDTELARRWRTAYPRRRSMLDELGKAGY